MSKCLPYGGFQWTNPEDFDTNKILNMTDNQQKGYYFEVDLEYPKELNDKHSDLPYCPENILNGEELPKLFATLYDKNNVLHYLNLKQALEAGLRLKKIHKILEFD